MRTDCRLATAKPVPAIPKLPALTAKRRLYTSPMSTTDHHWVLGNVFPAIELELSRR